MKELWKKGLAFSVTLIMALGLIGGCAGNPGGAQEAASGAKETTAQAMTQADAGSDTAKAASTSAGTQDMNEDADAMAEETAGGQSGIEGSDGMSTSTIYLAGGCFWGTQKFFDQFSGVIETEVGYANGNTENPSYYEVCSGSGHAETVKIVYDPEKISLPQLLEYYFMVIDPTSVNRQGNDVGGQYRTGIYYEDESLLDEIQTAYKAEEEKTGLTFVVEVLPLDNYYAAEEKHQKYLDKNPLGYCHIPRNMFNLEGSGQN